MTTCVQRPEIAVDEIVHTRLRGDGRHFSQRRLDGRTNERPRRRSRDIRGIGTSFKITPQVSSPASKGPPIFGAEWSVNRRLSLRWFEPNTRHQRITNYCWENSRVLRECRAAMRTVRRIVGSVLAWAFAGLFANTFGTYT